MHGIILRSSSQSLLQGFANSNWGPRGKVYNDKRSTSGLVMYSGANPILWSCKKQPTICRSNIEVEYKAFANVTIEIM